MHALDQVQLTLAFFVNRPRRRYFPISAYPGRSVWPAADCHASPVLLVAIGLGWRGSGLIPSRRCYAVYANRRHWRRRRSIAPA